MWFRSDLRLGEHSALTAAVAARQPIVCLYILDDETAGNWRAGGASRWWLHHSLESLSKDIDAKGNLLILRNGAALDVLSDVIEETGATAVYFTRSYEPHAVDLELKLRRQCEEAGVELHRFGGSLLCEPEETTTKEDTPYKVYTPFWRALASTFQAPKCKPVPKSISAPKTFPASDALDEWKLLPTNPNWAKSFHDVWTPGETGAAQRLKAFLDDALPEYKSDRDRPDNDGTSRLSPHLHFGEISPRQIWRQAQAAGDASSSKDAGLEAFLKELVWREFSYSLLFHWPDLPSKAFRENFEEFPWARDRDLLRAWQRGETGYPIVDAGMRELWTTGYMHNRVRMIVASFLIKDLMQPWQDGQAWFWDTLVDADLANNSASWQWVAGSGADAAPYFRIFNPITQGSKFDPDGRYVRRWIPELKKLPDDNIHAPWTADAETLSSAGVVLGKTYPKPIVDHKAARQRALAAYEKIKNPD